MQDSAPGDMVVNGEWEIHINEEITTEMAQLKLTEVDNDGVKQFVIFLPPEGCDDMADQLKEHAQWIREHGHA